jgi:hypothetical protein
MVKFDDPPPDRRPDKQATNVRLRRKGTVDRYFDDIKMGTIRGHGGKKYTFIMADWVSPEMEPKPGLKVVFELDTLRAVNIRVGVAELVKEPSSAETR